MCTSLYFVSSFIGNCSQGAKWQQVSTGSGDSLEQNRWQVFVWAQIAQSFTLPFGVTQPKTVNLSSWKLRNGYVLSTVANDALEGKHKNISIHSTDQIFLYWTSFILQYYIDREEQ